MTSSYAVLLRHHRDMLHKLPAPPFANSSIVATFSKPDSIRMPPPAPKTPRPSRTRPALRRMPPRRYDSQVYDLI